MVRIFSHYISARLILLIMLEAAVLIAAVRLGLWVHLAASDAATGVVDASVSLPAAAFGLGMVMVMKSMGLYQPSVLRDTQAVLTRLAAAVMLGLAVTALLMHLVPSLYLGIDGLAVAAVAALLGSGLVRLALFRCADLVPFKPRVLVLGTAAGAVKLAELAQRYRNHVLVGYIDVESDADRRLPFPRIRPARGESLLTVVDKYGVDQIVIAVKDRRGGGLPVQDLLDCRLKGVTVTELSTFYEREHRLLSLEALNPGWMVFGEGFRQGVVRSLIKRLFDLAASMLLLLAALPVMVFTAICIFWESGLPLLYRQKRVGQGGRSFTIYKFRSMAANAESDGKPRWAGANDDRTTRVGRIIRKLRIDELPQVFNVLRGEMSFVGPRPERPYFVGELARQIPYYALRHSVKPGITGWAQVRYPYGASVEDAIEKLQYDLYYVKNHTLFLDLIILVNTVEVVLWGGGSGASAPGLKGGPEARSALTPASLDSK